MGRKIANQPGYVFNQKTKRWVRDSGNSNKTASVPNIKEGVGSTKPLRTKKSDEFIQNSLGIHDNHSWGEYSKSDTYEGLLSQMMDEHDVLNNNGNTDYGALSAAIAHYRDYFLEDYADWVTSEDEPPLGHYYVSGVQNPIVSTGGHSPAYHSAAGGHASINRGGHASVYRGGHA